LQLSLRVKQGWSSQKLAMSSSGDAQLTAEEASTALVSLAAVRARIDKLSRTLETTAVAISKAKEKQDRATESVVQPIQSWFKE